VNAPVSCPPPASDSADIDPLGDFPGDPDPSVTAPLSAHGTPLALPADALSLLVNVGDPSSFWGIADVPPAGDVDVLVWSKLAPCQLTARTNAVQGQSLGMTDGRHALLVAGDDLPLLIDWSTGVIVPLAVGLQVPRLFSTITPFGSGALIAGGARPAPGSGPVDTAEVYVPSSDGSPGSISVDVIALSGPRAQPGALVLPTGETLLVGGLSSPATASNTLEEVSPLTHESTLLGVTLATARAGPTVLELPNGQIFVAGGFDGAGKPVSTAEWFDLALTTRLGVADVAPPASPPDAGSPATPTAYLYAPLEGGAVLGVIAWDQGQLDGNVALLRACDPAGGSCSPEVQRGVPLGASARPAAPAATLYAAANSAPALWTGTMWVRWDPWADAFAPVVLGGDAGASPGPVGLATLAPDPGLAAWVSGDGHVLGLRYDARGPYVTDSTISSHNSAPDRLAAGTLVTKPDTGWNLGGTPGLTVSSGAQVFVTDATFDEVTIDVTMQGNWAAIVLQDRDGDSFEVGGPACPFPAFTEIAEVVVARQGAQVTVAINGAPPVTCPTGLPAEDRLSVGVQALAGPSVLDQLTVTR
jgi:hypothetical protein